MSKGNGGKLGTALRAINRYMVAEDSIMGGCSQSAFDAVRKIKQECLSELLGVNDELVQAIAARLMLDRHYANARQMIRKLVERVEH